MPETLKYVFLRAPRAAVLGPGGEDLGPLPGEGPGVGAGGRAGDAVRDGAGGAVGVGD